MVLHEIPPAAEPAWDITRETAGYHLTATMAFRDIQASEFAGLFLSGGRAPEYLRYDRDLLRITRHFFETRKPVAALCHGIEILTAADCIRGRTVTTVAKCASMQNKGAPATSTNRAWSTAILSRPAPGTTTRRFWRNLCDF